MQKHAGALGTWAGEMRSKEVPLLWGPAMGAGPTAGRQGGVCCEGCSAEQRLGICWRGTYLKQSGLLYRGFCREVSSCEK